jgi:tetratricopeptide (TPR) repeat protein
MACRPDLRFLLAVAAALVLVPPLSAAPGTDPLADAARALDSGDAIGAELAVGRALRAGLAREDLAALAGETELVLGDFTAARSWLEGGTFAEASAQRGFHALARLEMLEGNVGAAARAFDRALDRGPANARLWVDIGRFRYANGQHRLAVQAAERAVAIDPAEPRALEFRGQLLRDAEGVRAAAAWFERAVEQAPDDLGLLGEYAATLAEANENRAMLRVARRMVEIDPRHPRAYFLQAVLAARAGQDNLARRLLWRTEGAYDEVPAGQILAGILELRTGNAALAVRQFDALVREQPDNSRVALLLGRALLASGDAGEVVERFGATAGRADASPYLLTLVGRAFEQLGRRSEAAAYLDRAGAAGAQSPGVLPVGTAGDLALWRTGGELENAGAAVPLLRRLLADGRADEALALSAGLGGHYPESADVARLRGDVALLAGEPATALALYSQASEIRSDVALVERMVAAQRQLGEGPAARLLLAAHVRSNPRASGAAALLGRMSAMSGDWNGAAALLGHAERLGGNDPLLLADLAIAQLADGDPRTADATARRAFALHRGNGRVAAVLARTLQAGEPQLADVLLAKSRALAAPELLAGR